VVAATDIIAPVSATKLAIGGLGAFLGWTDDFRAEGLITAPLLGVLITMVDQRTRVAREVADTLGATDLPIFDTTIPRRAAAEDQVGAKTVVGDDGINSDLADAYERFVQEVIHRARLTHG
jgi:chromosome partitioning protein